MRTALLALFFIWSSASAAGVFSNEKFSHNDAVLVTDNLGEIIFQWQIDKPLVPASLSKLLTSYLALNKWGPDHRFNTDFYIFKDQLWVKGYGDPFLISEEIELLASELMAALPEVIHSIHIDANYFAKESVPGRSSVSDPYNAPLSAVAANFNTVKLKRVNGIIQSAEQQTPLTDTAIKLVKSSAKLPKGKATRINLIDGNRAQQHFAEILLAKLALVSGVDQQQSPQLWSININRSLPDKARLIYQYHNSNTLSQILRGTLEFSNNFIANQLFLLFAEGGEITEMSFARASSYVAQNMKFDLNWPATARMVEGAGLSHANSLSAKQVGELLTKLKDNKALLKKYRLRSIVSNSITAPFAYAKSGTLDGVHNLAGYLELSGQTFPFVFIFNRTMPYRHRELLLQKLADQLSLVIKA